MENLQSELDQKNHEMNILRSKVSSGDSQVALMRSQLSSLSSKPVPSTSSKHGRGGDGEDKKSDARLLDLNNSFSEEFSAFINQPVIRAPSAPLQSALKSSFASHAKTNSGPPVLKSTSTDNMTSASSAPVSKAKPAEKPSTNMSSYNDFDSTLAFENLLNLDDLKSPITKPKNRRQ